MKTKNKLTKLLKTGILLFGISLLLWNCEKEEPEFITESVIHETIAKKITINQLKQENRNSTIFSDISQNLDITKGFLSKAAKKEDKIIVLTDEILKAEKNNITTYAFRLEKPTSKSSDFENLMIFKYADNSHKMILLKYQYTGKEKKPLSIKYRKIKVNELQNFDFLNQFSAKRSLDIELDDCIGVSYECPYGGTTAHGPEVCGPNGNGPGSTMILDFTDCFNNMGGGGSGGTGDGGDGGTGVGGDGGNDGSSGGGGSSGGVVNPPCEDPIHGCAKFPWMQLANKLQITDQNEIDFLEDNRILVDEINSFLDDNNNSIEAKNFAYQSILALMDLTNYINTFEEFVASNQINITNYINSLENPLYSDPIEFYLIAKYNFSDILALSIFAKAGNSLTIGEYTVTPNYDNNNTLVFYAAARKNGKNLGIEYIIKPSALQSFTDKVGLYTYAANLFYLGGIPSQGQIAYAAGDYWSGLGSMWNDALHSEEWWAYTILSFGQAIINLPVNTTVNSIQTTPNWRVSLNRMTSRTVQGKIVQNPQGIRVTIDIPDNYVPSIANNNKGINFRPLGSNSDSNLIRIMQPTTQNPNGYVVFYNSFGQPFNPINGQTLSRANWHFGF